MPASRSRRRRGSRRGGRIPAHAVATATPADLGMDLWFGGVEALRPIKLTKKQKAKLREQAKEAKKKSKTRRSRRGVLGGVTGWISGLFSGGSRRKAKKSRSRSRRRRSVSYRAPVAASRRKRSTSYRASGPVRIPVRKGGLAIKDSQGNIVAEYHIRTPKTERRLVIDNLVHKDGGLPVYRALIARRTLLKNTANKTMLATLTADANYVKKRYYNTSFWSKKTGNVLYEPKLHGHLSRSKSDVDDSNYSGGDMISEFNDNDVM